ncbi:MAG: RING finger domain protein [Terrestrivirus sp.]|uniref:RING finger domain protein n=1 Tax=Terrestrivirus sp. TaxID=2487775 RepID=A0A3G4ZR49_9VIRU|nr:MAG: RING finger domain protein [Terrestrivirus sp.]
MANFNKNNVISKLSDKQILGLWLLDYDISYDIIQIHNLFHIHKIPITLFFWKFIYRQKLINRTIDEIYTDLVAMELINFDNFDRDSAMLLSIIEIVNTKSCLKNMNTITQDLVIFIEKLFKVELDLEKCVHVGQPIPDPNIGRPYIDWKICKYPYCGKNFPSGTDLVRHLEKMGCYIDRFHWYHEGIVKAKNLTPQKVIDEKINACPSVICGNSDISTPEDVIEHLTELGIEPFFQQGMIIKTQNPFIDKYTKNKGIQKFNVFDSEECAVCLDEKPALINIPCNHKLYCISCYKTGKFIKCSYCGKNITSLVPFG